jgi:hypothetical protein
LLRTLPGPITLLLAAQGVFAAAPQHLGPAVAVEDTMHTEVPPVLVSAPRVTLDEILDRVARGEAHRDSLIVDETYLESVRVVGHTGEGQTPKLVEEDVTQVWKRRPHLSRRVPLRHWSVETPGKHKEHVDVQIDSDDDVGEDIVNFAFQPSARRDFKFHIEDRKLLGDHLVYRLGFEPRSPLALDLPGGTVWVDTRDYVIVRQEIQFHESPLPMFVRGIRRLVVEREKVGELWVLARLIARIEMTIPVPHVGRSFDFALSFTQYAINTGLPDSLFAHPRPTRAEAKP